MSHSGSTQSDLEIYREEMSKVFDTHLEALDKTMDKNLIITVATCGGFVNRKYNPNVPVTTDEVAQEAVASWKAGAAIWHFDPRDTKTGLAVSLEKRIEIHKEWCDAVFEKAPDLITLIQAAYVKPVSVAGRVVDLDSLLAENRMAPLIEPLIKMGRNNRYVEIVGVTFSGGPLGPSRILGFNNRDSVLSDIEFLQSRGIRLQLDASSYPLLRNVQEWVLKTGVGNPPMILNTAWGIHNCPTPASTMEAFDWLLPWVRAIQRLPQGVLWSQMIGGRQWLPLTVASIMLGADIVRVGMEDAVYMYPHKNDYIRRNSETVEAIAGISKYLGREVATPSEARKILGLPQVSRNP